MIVTIAEPTPAQERAIAEHKMKQLAGSGGHIDIAYVFPLANYYIPHTVRSFLDIDRNKHVTFNFNQTHTADMIQGLKSDRHDVIFGSFVADEPDISFIPILHQDMVVITPKNHPLAQKDTVSCSDLTEYPLIGYDRYSGLGGFTRNFYKEKKLKVNIVCECPDENAIAALVAEDFGIALVARVDAVDQANVEVLPLADADLTHTVYMGYIRDKYQIPAVKRFIQFVKRDGKAY